jgi:hypothetical protein
VTAFTVTSSQIKIRNSSKERILYQLLKSDYLKKFNFYIIESTQPADEKEFDFDI